MTLDRKDKRNESMFYVLIRFHLFFILLDDKKVLSIIIILTNQSIEKNFNDKNQTSCLFHVNEDKIMCKSMSLVKPEFYKTFFFVTTDFYFHNETAKIIKRVEISSLDR